MIIADERTAPGVAGLLGCKETPTRQELLGAIHLKGRPRSFEEMQGPESELSEADSLNDFLGWLQEQRQQPASHSGDPEEGPL